MDNDNIGSDCARRGGRCPTFMGLIVTLVLAIAVGVGFQNLAGVYLPIQGALVEIVDLGIVIAVIISGVVLLRAFRARG